jgi:hypothetical protein
MLQGGLSIGQFLFDNLPNMVPKDPEPLAVIGFPGNGLQGCGQICLVPLVIGHSFGPGIQQQRIVFHASQAAAHVPTAPFACTTCHGIAGTPEVRFNRFPEPDLPVQDIFDAVGLDAPQASGVIIDVLIAAKGSANGIKDNPAGIAALFMKWISPVHLGLEDHADIVSKFVEINLAGTVVKPEIKKPDQETANRISTWDKFRKLAAVFRDDLSVANRCKIQVSQIADVQLNLCPEVFEKGEYLFFPANALTGDDSDDRDPLCIGILPVIVDPLHNRMEGAASRPLKAPMDVVELLGAVKAEAHMEIMGGEEPGKRFCHQGSVGLDPVLEPNTGKTGFQFDDRFEEINTGQQGLTPVPDHKNRGVMATI